MRAEDDSGSTCTAALFLPWALAWGRSNRYHLCQHLQLDENHQAALVSLQNGDLPSTILQDKWAAIVWMCRNQLGRRNQTDEQRTYTIGKMYEAQKMTQGTNNQYVQAKSEKDQNGLFQKKYDNTAKKIADDFKVGERTVKRAERFVDGLDEAEKISPGIREAVLSGEVKAPKSVVAEIRNVPEEHRPQVVDAIKRGPTCWNSIILMAFHFGASAELDQKQNDHFDHIVF